MDVSGHLHAPDDLLWRKCPRYPLKGKLDETQSLSGRSREDINLIRFQGLEPRLLGNLASRRRSQQNHTSLFLPLFINLNFELHGRLVIIWDKWIRKWYWPISRPRYTNPGHQVVEATKICGTAPNICGSSELNLLRVTFPTSKILRRTLHIWKVYVSLF